MNKRDFIFPLSNYYVQITRVFSLAIFLARDDWDSGTVAVFKGFATAPVLFRRWDIRDTFINTFVYFVT